MNRRRLLAIGAVISLAGCTTTSDIGEDPDPDPDPEELFRDAIERRKEMDSLAGRRVVTADDGMERTEQIYERPPANQRIAVIDATNATVAPGDVSVSTRPATWEYDSASETVTKRHQPHEIVTDRVRLVLETLLEECCLTYEGTEAVAGRETHVLSVAPPPDDDVETSIDILVGDTTYVIPIEEVPPEEREDAEVRRTLYICDDERYPVKEQDSVTVDGEVLHSLTATFETLTIDGDLSSGTFEYEPPAGADVDVTGLEPEGIYDSITDADATVPYTLPAPSIPEPYILDRVTVVQMFDSLTTTLWYLDPEWTERELYVRIRPEPRFNEDVLDPVEINGHEGFYRDGRIESVFWNCGGLSYEVSSPDVAEPVIDIAATIDCG